MTCPLCSYPYQPAPSKRLNPCPNCLHKAKTGEYLTEARRRKAKESLERSRLRAHEKQLLKPKTSYKIPQFSEKGKQRANQVEATKRKLKQGAKDGSHTQCEGCGKFVKQIDGSHIVPLSQSQALASDKENIRLLCRECHVTWEGFELPDVVELACFLEDMAYLMRVDNPRFWNLFQKLLDYHLKTPTAKVERAIKRIEKFTN